jgi:Lhr-like helicase
LTRNVGNGRWPFGIKECPVILVTTPAIIGNFVRGPIVREEELFDKLKYVIFDEVKVFET